METSNDLSNEIGHNKITDEGVQPSSKTWEPPTENLDPSIELGVKG